MFKISRSKWDSDWPLFPYTLLLALATHISLIILFLLLPLLAGALNDIFPGFSDLFRSRFDHLANERPPIVLEFDQPPAPLPETIEQPVEELVEEKVVEEEQKTLPPDDQWFRVVDNPNADKVNPDKTGLLAADASISAAPVLSGKPPSAVPLNDVATTPESTGGDAETVEISEASRNEEEKPAEEEKAIDLDKVLDLNGSFAYSKGYEPRPFSRDLLAKKQQTNETNQKQFQGSDGVELVEQEFDASLIGDLRLSTYAWEWAPWFKDFEKRYHRVWFPPSAWNMGLVHGYTIVRLKIAKSGEKLELEVLRKEGHESIHSCIMNAFESVFPVKQLPDHFPDEYLELWIRVEMPDVRLLRQRAGSGQQRRSN